MRELGTKLFFQAFVEDYVRSRYPVIHIPVVPQYLEPVTALDEPISEEGPELRYEELQTRLPRRGFLRGYLEIPRGCQFPKLIPIYEHDKAEDILNELFYPEGTVK